MMEEETNLAFDDDENQQVLGVLLVAAEEKEVEP